MFYRLGVEIYWVGIELSASEMPLKCAQFSLRGACIIGVCKMLYKRLGGFRNRPGRSSLCIFFG